MSRKEFLEKNPAIIAEIKKNRLVETQNKLEETIANLKNLSGEELQIALDRASMLNEFVRDNGLMINKIIDKHFDIKSA